MNQLTLVLNAAILVVTFVVALTAGDVQGRMLTSAARSPGTLRAGRAASAASTIAVIRVVQSMDSFYPASAENPLTREQIEVLQQAVELYSADTRIALDRMLRDADGGRDLRQELVSIGRATRVDLEAVLSRGFKNSGVVSRIATELIRSFR